MVWRHGLWTPCEESISLIDGIYMNNGTLQNSRLRFYCTKLAAVSLLLLCAQEPLQAFQILHVVLFAPWGVEHRGGRAIASSQAGTFCWSDTAGVGSGARGGTVVQHLKQRHTLTFQRRDIKSQLITLMRDGPFRRERRALLHCWGWTGC